jgi:hypothetical protein
MIAEFEARLAAVEVHLATACLYPPFPPETCSPPLTDRNFVVLSLTDSLSVCLFFFFLFLRRSSALQPQLVLLAVTVVALLMMVL